MIRNVVIDKDTEKGKYPELKTLLTLLTNEHCRYNFIEQLQKGIKCFEQRYIQILNAA